MEDTVRLPLSLKGVHRGESPGWHLAVVRICEALLGMSKQCARDSGCCSEGMFAPCLSCVSCMEGNVSTTIIRNQRSPTISLDNLRLLYELLFSTHNRKKEWVIVAHGRRVPWTHDKTHWPDAWSEGTAAGVWGSWPHWVQSGNREMNVGSYLAFSFWFSPGLQPVGSCFVHPEQVFPVKPLGKYCHRHIWWCVS